MKYFYQLKIGIYFEPIFFVEKIFSIRFKSCGKIYSFIVSVLSKLYEDTKRKYEDNYKFLHEIFGKTE